MGAILPIPRGRVGKRGRDLDIKTRRGYPADPARRDRAPWGHQGDALMTFRRPTPGLVLAVVLALAPAAAADESPVGKIVAKVIPVNNRAVSSEYITSQMHTR